MLSANSTQNITKKNITRICVTKKNNNLAMQAICVCNYIHIQCLIASKQKQRHWKCYTHGKKAATKKWEKTHKPTTNTLFQIDLSFAFLFQGHLKVKNINANE